MVRTLPMYNLRPLLLLQAAGAAIG
ncbi:MAG: hypothetical protein HW377_2714, partial [Actinobacteria bacterium]|nr:hypothetical protein [Actinomycetota bacterium]